MTGEEGSINVGGPSPAPSASRRPIDQSRGSETTCTWGCLTVNAEVVALTGSIVRRRLFFGQEMFFWHDRYCNPYFKRTWETLGRSQRYKRTHSVHRLKRSTRTDEASSGVGSSLCASLWLTPSEQPCLWKSRTHKSAGHEPDDRQKLRNECYWLGGEEFDLPKRTLPPTVWSYIHQRNMRGGEGRNNTCTQPVTESLKMTTPSNAENPNLCLFSVFLLFFFVFKANQNIPTLSQVFPFLLLPHKITGHSC